MKRFALIALALISLNTWAKDLTDEMDALGANKDLMKKAAAIDAQNRVRVVQNREVDRNLRFEFGLNYGAIATGGDPYVNTTMFGGQMDFHINPHWSLGARYTNYQNKLSSEGQSMFDDFSKRQAAQQIGVIPQYSWDKDSWLGVINWYPVYGKINWFDAGVSQFDLYLLGGAGEINRATGMAPLYTADVGIGVWMFKHMSTRLEARWEGHTDQTWDGANWNNRQMNEMVMSATVGFIL
jgi:outer membrane immunogenic protein